MPHEYVVPLTRSDVHNIYLDDNRLNLLVHIYKDYPHLWDVNHPWYYSRSRRFKSYVSMSQRMNVNGLGAPEIARRMRTIWLSLLAEIQKSAESKNPSRQIAETGNNRILPWYQLAQLLIEGQELPGSFSYSIPVEIQDTFDVTEDIAMCVDDSEMDVDNTVANKRSNSYGNEHLPTKRFQCEQKETLFGMLKVFINPLQFHLALQAEIDIHDILIKFNMMRFNEIRNRCEYYV